MKRFYMAAAAMSVLAIAYQAYASWFRSITALEEPMSLAVPRDTTDRPQQPPELARRAEEILPGLDWAPHARYAYERQDNLYIYADSAEPVDDGEGGANLVQFKPFAMIVSDPDDPEADPYVIRCESARIRFENPFRLEFGATKPGRLVGGTLDGAVAITGPDGLEIYGHDFVFSEESAHLYSYYPVAFAFGPDDEGNGRQSGSAQQLQIDLVASHEGVLGRDGPRIGGIARVILRHDVRLDLTWEQDGEFANATITSRGVFEYDVASRIATFEDDVVVRRPTSDPGEPLEVDELRCDWLALQFEPEPAESNGPELAADSSGEAISPVSASSADDDRSRHPFAGLRFRRLRAHGERAVLHSEQNQFQSRMHELRYDALQRQVLLLDDESVRLTYRSSELMSPDVEVVHDAGGDVVSLDCGGTGRLEQYPDDGGPPVFHVYWDRHLGYRFDPDVGLWLIQVDGRARFVQVGQMGIQADQLALWIDPEAARALAERDQQSEPVMNPGSLPLRFAQGTGHVLMASPRFRVETDRLQATITPVDPGAPASGEGAPASLLERETETDPESGTDPQQGWTLRAQEVQVAIVHNPRTEETDLAEATAAGDVLISRDNSDGSAAEDPVSISGDELHLDRRGAGELLTLHGAPAHIRRENLHLEARNVVFDRLRNTAHVDGRGMLRFPVSADLNGKRLEDPVPLDVHWQEQMTFDGLQAQFFGNVVMKLNDGRVNESRLYCEDLHVLLDRKVSFTEQPAESQPAESTAEEPVQFQRVTCRDGVRTELYEWEGTRLSGIRVFELAELTLEHDTGVLEGLGPGVIRSWTRGSGRRISIAPDASAEANRPAESDQQEWEYTQVHFSRNMTGNARQKLVELHGRVRAIYAPVQHPREVFTRDDLSGDSPNADNAIWLGCEQLAVSLHPWEMHEDEDYAVFGATGQCELEGKRFNAVADLISFDQSKELFTLKGLGDGKASIYFRRNPGDHPQRLPAQIIQFIPSRNWVNVDRASGFQASP